MFRRSILRESTTLGSEYDMYSITLWIKHYNYVSLQLPADLQGLLCPCLSTFVQLLTVSAESLRQVIWCSPRGGFYWSSHTPNPSLCLFMVLESLLEVTQTGINL